jgi:hypothetical protein
LGETLFVNFENQANKEQQSSATEELTLKKESPGPKMIDGLMIVLSGFSFKKAFSPCSLVRQLYNQLRSSFQSHFQTATSQSSFIQLDSIRPNEGLV